MGKPPAPEGPSSLPQGGREVEAFARLRDLVLGEGGIDLGLYKDRCVVRRIAVRQRACGAADLTGYLRLVGRDPVERERLVKSLTIHVSQFFRNPATFDAVRKSVLPVILGSKRAAGRRTVRIWSAGCACGEEAYSLGILLAEEGWGEAGASVCTVYGTDIEPACLVAAQAGIYAAASLVNVPPRWRRRHFQPTGERFQVVPALRRQVFFRRHNVLDPPPFRRIDLLFFRNVLIYMSEPLQRRVLARLREALNPGGFLVLGKVEGIPEAGGEAFEAVSIAERIYRKRETRA